MRTDTSCVMVLFGSTGDLARRKLYPALFSLFIENLLPDDFAVVAMGRRSKTNAELKQDLKNSIKDFSRHRSDLENIDWDGFYKLFTYLQADINDPSGYETLSKVLKSFRGKGLSENQLFYLAVSPEFFAPIVTNLEKHKVIRQENGWQRVVFEKPFGHDLESAHQLNRQVNRVFHENQIYRIDHYLGKEMIQNIMVIRFANAFFEPLWNSRSIDSIQIQSNETAGVEGRGEYYDGAGALRDMVQNHMLQLLTMVAMEPPSSLEAEPIRDEKVKVLRSLKPLTGENIRRDVVSGQYGPGQTGNQKVAGFRQEQEVNSRSNTETYLAMKIFLDNFRWAGTPFYLRTGKRMRVKSTEVIIQFKALAGTLYFKEYGEMEPNILVIRVQPQEGIFMQLNAKKPGTSNFIAPIKMDFCQNCQVGFNSPEAYERLILDVMKGDATLFTRWDEVEAAWKFIDPITREWAAWKNAFPFPNYAAGDWGPEAAELLPQRDGRKWINL